jgi:hypothetical protein
MTETDDEFLNIPREAVEAGARPIYEALEGPVANQDFARQQRQWEAALKVSRVAIAAAIEAWPGGTDNYSKYGDGTPVIILPLEPKP